MCLDFLFLMLQYLGNNTFKSTQPKQFLPSLLLRKCFATHVSCLGLHDQTAILARGKVNICTKTRSGTVHKLHICNRVCKNQPCDYT